MALLHSGVVLPFYSNRLGNLYIRFSIPKGGPIPRIRRGGEFC